MKIILPPPPVQPSKDVRYLPAGTLFLCNSFPGSLFLRTGVLSNNVGAVVELPNGFARNAQGGGAESITIVDAQINVEYKP